MVLSNLGEGEWKFGMKQETEKSLDPSAVRIVACLDGLPPSLRFGDASRQAKVNAFPLATTGSGTMCGSPTRG